MPKKSVPPSRSSSESQLPLHDLVPPIDSAQSCTHLPDYEKKYHTDFVAGLTLAEAKRRLVIYGHNQMTEIKKKSGFVKFIGYFASPLVLLLLFIAITLGLMGDYAEASLVVLMVVISVILDSWQEARADQAVAKLQERVAHYCEVIRDGQKQNILATDLVPGDILVLNAGDVISADGLVIESKDFFVNQSALTGESFPMEKVAPTQAEFHSNPTLDQINDNDLTKSYLVFDGTNVSSGTANVLIVKTGAHTQFSHVAATLTLTEAPSQFTVGITKFSKMILKIVAVTILGVFVLYKFVGGHGWLDTLAFSVAIAVGITPDFLTVIMSLCMSFGAQRMAKKGVIVKKMAAMPNFGSTEILCTDKTGTITQDKITLVKHTGVYGKNDDDVLLFAQLNSHFQGGITNVMDEAILNHFYISLDGYQKIDEIPFDFNRRALSVVVEEKKTGERFLITKGAPETIYPLLTHYHEDGHRVPASLTQTIKDELDLQYRLLSEDGFRVLAIAIKRLGKNDKRTAYTQADEKDLEIMGFASFLDPVKKDVKKTIQDLLKINVHVKVITGDSEIVARKICLEAGVENDKVMTGDELEKMTDEELSQRALETSVFARFSPSQKERVIKALRLSGKSVAYLGDGINDAPSLRAADVGISVDNAVDVAREAADLIMTHNSLAELCDGMIEGRKTFVNTMKYVRIGVASSVGNVISLVVAAFLLPFLPMMPLQILLNDFLYDMSQLTLAGDQVDDIQVLQPQKWDLSEIKRFILIFGPLSSIFDITLFLILTMVFHAQAAEFQTSWFVFSVLTQMLALFIMRTPYPLLKSHPSKTLLVTSIVLVIGGITLAFSPLGYEFFGFSNQFSALMWLMTLLIVFAYTIGVEIAKKFYYRKLLAENQSVIA